MAIDLRLDANHTAVLQEVGAGAWRLDVRGGPLGKPLGCARVAGPGAWRDGVSPLQLDPQIEPLRAAIVAALRAHGVAGMEAGWPSV